jgi:NADH-quinone oxidoreductase subunit N
MNLLDAVGLAGFLVPEIVLAGLTFGVLLLDILRRKIGSVQNASVEYRHEFLGRVVLAGLAVTFLLYLVQLGQTPMGTLGQGAFVASSLNTIFKLLVVALTFVTVVFGLQTPYSSHVGEYYSLILFCLLGMVFLISSEDLLMIFVALELVSLTLYALTAFQKGARRSVEAGLKYFIFGGLSSAFLLFGLSYIYGVTGQTGLQEIAQFLKTNAGNLPVKMLNIGILFSLVGLGFKIAAVPFHLWAPDAYEGAPTPVAALIATGSKVASFLVLTKLMLVGLVGVAGNALSWPTLWQPGWTTIVAIIAVLSMVLGNVAAIAQKNVKRLLAYSSVAHAGYILVAIVAINSAGVPAELAAPSIYFYILIYSLTNIGAFGVVNAIASKAGGDDFEHFTGMAKRAPFLSFLMLIFMLSLAGIPPLAGFFGKFYLFAAAVQADPKNLGLLWLVALAIAMSAVSLYYYLKLTKQMYVLPAKNPERLAPCPTTYATLGLVCLAVILLGVFPSRLVETFQNLNKPIPTLVAPTVEKPVVPVGLQPKTPLAIVSPKPSA